MNNNYHTQMDKQTNMLNEIAANNQLLQNDKSQALIQQMQNFQGTPVNKTQPTQKNLPQMNPQTAQMAQMNPQMAQMAQQMNPQLMQQMNPQLMQQMNPQLMQQMAREQVERQVLAQQPYATHLMNQQQQEKQIDNDEIELSEAKPDPKQKLNEIAQQVNKQQAEVEQSKQAKPMRQPLQPQQIQQMQQMPRRYSPAMYPMGTRPPPVAVPTKKNNTVVQYVVIPILLVIIFVALVHPKTSAILEKYIPKMTNMKGYLVRGAILAILYIVIITITNMIGGKKK